MKRRQAHPDSPSKKKKNSLVPVNRGEGGKLRLVSSPTAL